MEGFQFYGDDRRGGTAPTTMQRPRALSNSRAEADYVNSQTRLGNSNGNGVQLEFSAGDAGTHLGRQGAGKSRAFSHMDKWSGRMPHAREAHLDSNRRDSLDPTDPIGGNVVAADDDRHFASPVASEHLPTTEISPINPSAFPHSPSQARVSADAQGHTAPARPTTRGAMSSYASETIAELNSVLRADRERYREKESRPTPPSPKSPASRLNHEHQYGQRPWGPASYHTSDAHAHHATSGGSDIYTFADSSPRTHMNMHSPNLVPSPLSPSMSPQHHQDHWDIDANEPPLMSLRRSKSHSQGLSLSVSATLSASRLLGPGMDLFDSSYDSKETLSNYFKSIAMTDTQGGLQPNGSGGARSVRGGGTGSHFSVDSEAETGDTEESCLVHDLADLDDEAEIEQDDHPVLFARHSLKGVSSTGLGRGLNGQGLQSADGALRSSSAKLQRPTPASSVASHPVAVIKLKRHNSAKLSKASLRRSRSNTEDRETRDELESPLQRVEPTGATRPITRSPETSTPKSGMMREHFGSRSVSTLDFGAQDMQPLSADHSFGSEIQRPPSRQCDPFPRHLADSIHIGHARTKQAFQDPGSNVAATPTAADGLSMSSLYSTISRPPSRGKIPNQSLFLDKPNTPAQRQHSSFGRTLETRDGGGGSRVDRMRPSRIASPVSRGLHHRSSPSFPVSPSSLSSSREPQHCASPHDSHAASLDVGNGGVLGRARGGKKLDRIAQQIHDPKADGFGAFDPTEPTPFVITITNSLEDYPAPDHETGTNDADSSHISREPRQSYNRSHDSRHSHDAQYTDPEDDSLGSESSGILNSSQDSSDPLLETNLADDFLNLFAMDPSG